MLRTALKPRFQFLRFLDHLHNFVITAAAAYRLHTDRQLSLLENRSRIDKIVQTLSDRIRFTGQRCLIDRCLTLYHNAIKRNRVAHMDDNLIACCNLLCIHKYLSAILHKPDFANV